MAEEEDKGADKNRKPGEAPSGPITAAPVTPAPVTPVAPPAAAPGWVVLLTAASPAFVVNAISLYSMPAHLLASACFAALLLDPTPRRLILAGAVGSLALALHNPVPHMLVASPFIAALALRPGRTRSLAALAAGFQPGYRRSIGILAPIVAPARRSTPWRGSRSRCPRSTRSGAAP